MRIPFTLRISGHVRPEAIGRRRPFRIALNRFRGDFEDSAEEFRKSDLVPLFPGAKRVRINPLFEGDINELPLFSFRRRRPASGGPQVNEFEFTAPYEIEVLGSAAIAAAKANYPQIHRALEETFEHLRRSMEFDDLLNDRRFFRKYDGNSEHIGDSSYTQDIQEFPHHEILLEDPYIEATKRNIKARQTRRLLQGIEEVPTRNGLRNLPPGIPEHIAEFVAGPVRPSRAPRSRAVPPALSNATLQEPYYYRLQRAQKGSPEVRPGSPRVSPYRSERAEAYAPPGKSVPWYKALFSRRRAKVAPAPAPNGTRRRSRRREN